MLDLEQFKQKTFDIRLPDGQKLKLKSQARNLRWNWQAWRIFPKVMQRKPFRFW